MKEYFKKGQLVPKRLGMISAHKKVRHLVTFGTDVVVEGRTITPIREGVTFKVMPLYRTMRNGTRQKHTISICGVVVLPVGAGGVAAHNTILRTN